MNIADAALDDLIVRLNVLTGKQWQRYPPWDVAIVYHVDSEPWIYTHPVRLMRLDADPVGYAQMVAADFQEKKLKAMSNAA